MSIHSSIEWPSREETQTFDRNHHYTPFPSFFTLLVLSFAVQTVVSLINLLPTATLGLVSPWYKLYGHHPDLTHLKIFGCACYPLLRPYTHHKLENRTKECLFLGYSTVSKGYLCLDFTTNHLYTSRHVLFNESKFPFVSFIASKSAANISKPSHDTWFSNLLYLHSTNLLSVLGPYRPPASSHPVSSLQSDTVVAPPSPIPILIQLLFTYPT